jgi:hypothetical protein
MTTRTEQRSHGRPSTRKAVSTVRHLTGRVWPVICSRGRSHAYASKAVHLTCGNLVSQFTARTKVTHHRPIHSATC